MPDHTARHLSEMAKKSAAARRADLIARLIESAPPLSAEQVDRLRALLHQRSVCPTRTRR